MTLEQKEILFLIRQEIDKAIKTGIVVPDVVYELIDKVEKEYAD